VCVCVRVRASVRMSVWCMGVCLSSLCVVCGCVVCVCACVQTNVVDEEARKRMDETLFIFDRVPEKGCEKPSILARRGVLYIIPPAAQTRGPATSGKLLSYKKLMSCWALEWAGEAPSSNTRMLHSTCSLSNSLS
jgi:hypothetical protein